MNVIFKSAVKLVINKLKLLPVNSENYFNYTGDWINGSQNWLRNLHLVRWQSIRGSVQRRSDAWDRHILLFQWKEIHW